MVQAWVAHNVSPLMKHRYDESDCPTDESRVENHTKSTNYLINIITMVMEPLAPPAAWI
jgi:hypothetical protein